MISHFKRLLFALLLVTLVAATGYAQFGGLRKKLQEISGVEKTDDKASSGRRVVQYKPGERIPPLTTESVEQFMKAAKAEQAYAAMTPTERARADQQKDQQKTAREEAMAAKRAQRKQCMATVDADMIELQARMQKRMMQLAQAADPNAIAKAAEEMQQAVMTLVDKKCEPEVTNDESETDRSYVGFIEWSCAYVAVRQEQGPAAAAAAVLATESEVKMLDPHLAALQGICKA